MKRMLIPTLLTMVLVASACTSVKPVSEQEFWAQYPAADTTTFAAFVFDAIADSYSYLPYKQEELGFGWAEVRHYYEERLKSARSEEKALFLVDEALRLLSDGHTAVDHPAMPTVDSTLPLDVRREGEHLVVGAFTEAVAQGVDWMEPGLRVVTIDERDAMAVWAELWQESGYRLTNQGERLLAEHFFRTYYFNRGDSPQETSIVFEDAAGARRKLTLPWGLTPSLRGDGGLRFRKPPVKQRVAVDRLRGGSVGYIKLDTLSGVEAAEVDRAFESLADARALIIDLRGNMGGDFTRVGQRVVAHLIDKPVTTMTKEFRYSPLLHLYGSKSPDYPGLPSHPDRPFSQPIRFQTKPAATGRFTGKPVILLADEWIFSAADALLNAFADLKLGRIVGRTNPSHSGQPLHIPYPHQAKWSLSVSSILSRAPSGALIEGRLVEPDIFVPLTRREILGEGDPILEMALKALGV